MTIHANKKWNCWYFWGRWLIGFAREMFMILHTILIISYIYEEIKFKKTSFKKITIWVTEKLESVNKHTTGEFLRKMILKKETGSQDKCHLLINNWCTLRRIQYFENAVVHYDKKPSSTDTRSR